MQKVIIGALVLVIGYLIYRDFRPVPTIEPEVAKSQGKIDSLDALVASLEAARDTLWLRLETGSAEQAKQALKYKSKISNLTQKLAEKRPDIEPLLDSMPKLAAFVLLQDSIIDVQATRIDSLERQKARQWADFNRILDVQEEKFKASQEINVHLLQVTEHYVSENQKLKRQNRWLKIGVGAAFLGGVFLGR